MHEPDRPTTRVNGALIREARQGLGLKPDQFANLVRCSPQHLRNIELGHKNASPELLSRIARYLKVKRNQLLAAS